MKNYILTNKRLLGILVKKINYTFDCCNSPLANKFNKIIIHNTGRHKTIDSIIDNHIAKKKYSTIGYHFIIGKNGQIFYSRDLKFAGAHTYGFNKNAIGIAFLGDFNIEKPNEKQINSLKKLIEKLKKEYNIKYLYGHNEAIYKQVLNKFWKLSLDKKDILNISSLDNYHNFQKELTTKILENDASNETVSLIKRLKTCPGVNLYPLVLDVKKIIET